jgi:Tol biopolymer transport system component
MRRLLLAASAAALAAVVGALPGGAADRGSDGLVVFSQASGSIVTLDGSTEHMLTPSGALQTDPSVSPDGAKIAFVQSGHLYVETIAGTKAKAVKVGGNPFEGSPTWSPDATQLAYVDGTDGQIYTVKSGGGTPTRLTSGLRSVADLAWSPDGAKIAFDALDAASTHQLFTVATAKGGHLVTQLTSGSCASIQPDWSPDASELAFSTPCFDGTGQIATMPAGGGGASLVAFYKTYAGAGYPSWSPDGSTIVFSANEGKGSLQLWSSSPANSGGDGKQITATQLTFDGGQPNNIAPSWQPVHQPALSAPSHGAAGSAIQVSGSDFLSEQTVKLTFRDANGVKTSLGKAQTPLDGSFAKTVTIPSGAATGGGKLIASGGTLSATVSFTVG